MITLQAYLTLSPAPPLWMSTCLTTDTILWFTCANELPLTCEDVYFLEIFLIQCSLPGTPSIIFWIFGESTQSYPLPQSTFLRGEPGLLKSSVFCIKSNILSLSPYCFPWHIHFSKHFWSWSSKQLHSYPSNLSYYSKGEVSSSIINNSFHSNLASMSPPCSDISFDFLT